MNNKLLVGIVITVILILGSFYLGNSINTRTVVRENLGALAGPDIPSQWLRVGGVLKEYRSQSMVAATTSLCAMLSPAATSTLDYVSWIITTGTSTAANIDIGTSTTAFATTTVLVANTAVASGAQGQAQWSPSGSSANDNVVSPSTYVNIKTGGAGLSGYTFGGKCQAVFTVLQ
jgi:hypothetical protein